MRVKKQINKTDTEPKQRLVFAPKSEKQRMILQDEETKVILCGGGILSASTLKTTS